MIVVKLGGSLYDHPDLRGGLNQWLADQPGPVLLVPGGGEIADGVRAFDKRHGVGEEAAHWAAVRSLTVAGVLLAALVTRKDVEILDAFAFAREDEGRPDRLPHTWDVTTDSLALRAAVVRNAAKLILLKSNDLRPMTWEAAALMGFVDPHFPKIAAGVPFPIEVVNFRRYLDGQR